jgi:hypothetical protein
VIGWTANPDEEPALETASQPPSIAVLEIAGQGNEQNAHGMIGRHVNEQDDKRF